MKILVSMRFDAHAHGSSVIKQCSTSIPPTSLSRTDGPRSCARYLAQQGPLASCTFTDACADTCCRIHFFSSKWCKKLIVLCWHANGSHSPIQHVLGSGEDGMATDWLAQCYLSMFGSGRLKRLSRHWPHVSTRV